MKYLTSLFFSILYISIVAQNTPLLHTDALLKNIKATAKNTQSIEAHFTQEKKVNYLKEPILSSGKFYTQNGNMRWQQEKPYTYIMLVSASGIQIKNEEKEKKYGDNASKMVEKIRDLLIGSINGNFANDNNFERSYFENKDYYIVKMIPNNRRLSKMFQAIHLHFDKKNYRLKILQFVQQDGISSMQFSNEKFNQNLPQNIFEKF